VVVVGRDVAHLFRPGSANPVRYLPLDALLTHRSVPPASVAPNAAATPTETLTDEAVEPGLLERVLPLLDIVIDPVGARPKIVVENKLYSVPYPAQLIKYNACPLPWSPDHDESGAPDTRYALLSLMKPSFPLPSPWVHVDYRDLAEALDLVDADSLGRTSEQFVRYRALIHRLVALAEAVDPAQALDEQFSATDAVARLPGGGLDGAIARCASAGSLRSFSPISRRRSLSWWVATVAGSLPTCASWPTIGASAGSSRGTSSVSDHGIEAILGSDLP
jgi:hypothetical protein